jgi:hypothetical protein
MAERFGEESRVEGAFWETCIIPNAYCAIHHTTVDRLLNFEVPRGCLTDMRNTQRRFSLNQDRMQNLMALLIHWTQRYQLDQLHMKAPITYTAALLFIKLIQLGNFQDAGVPAHLTPRQPSHKSRTM